jgi:Mg/Co/Ni transporter MgtE
MSQGICIPLLFGTLEKMSRSKSKSRQWFRRIWREITSAAYIVSAHSCSAFIRIYCKLNSNIHFTFQ